MMKGMWPNRPGDATTALDEPVCKPVRYTDPMTGNADDESRPSKHQLSREGKTRCMGCGEVFPTELMTAKAIDFSSAGKPRRRVRYRTKGHICKGCLPNDEDWNLEKGYT